jgi:hypothetical protein
MTISILEMCAIKIICSWNSNTKRTNKLMIFFELAGENITDQYLYCIKQGKACLVEYNIFLKIFSIKDNITFYFKIFIPSTNWNKYLCSAEGSSKSSLQIIWVSRKGDKEINCFCYNLFNIFLFNYFFICIKTIYPFGFSFNLMQLSTIE